MEELPFEEKLHLVGERRPKEKLLDGNGGGIAIWATQAAKMDRAELATAKLFDELQMVEGDLKLARKSEGGTEGGEGGKGKGRVGGREEGNGGFFGTGG